MPCIAVIINNNLKKLNDNVPYPIERGWRLRFVKKSHSTESQFLKEKRREREERQPETTFGGSTEIILNLFIIILSAATE